jgi:hypothetical protein
MADDKKPSISAGQTEGGGAAALGTEAAGSTEADREAAQKMTALFHFSRAVRDDIRRENPNATFGELMQLITNAFQELSSEEIDQYAARADSGEDDTAADTKT